MGFAVLGVYGRGGYPGKFDVRLLSPSGVEVWAEVLVAPAAKSLLASGARYVNSGRGLAPAAYVEACAAAASHFWSN